MYTKTLLCYTLDMKLPYMITIPTPITGEQLVLNYTVIYYVGI